MITYPTSGEARRPGRIEVVCGSMFSGKTEELIRRLRRAQEGGNLQASHRYTL